MVQDISGMIHTLAEEKDAVILVHNYQIPEVQDVADIVGDSLELARAAADLSAEVIVFCGVDFMAETAAILSPEKTVLLPAPDAHCPMAGMITGGEVRTLRERFPDAAVVAYVNTTAEVKAESDICCTSANALKVVESLDETQVIMLPDRNLARYVARFTKQEILPWEGYCYVHDRIIIEDVRRARADHPYAELLVHPECRPEVIDLADHVHSTSGMIRHICASDKGEFIIGTEPGIIHQIEKRCPGKHAYPLSEKAICINMKKTGLENVLRSLESLTPRVTVPDEVAVRARVAIERMLRI
ncbi:quinolinate synthase NadA [Methanocalculus sp.]|uniref:quinolinate synthase NadA n=1 Tax=Methanocalculus sp. TaxID=2004547 RepID=UPI00271F98F7|nr:quinolinate synthase NadA [Methanocalculus sp.]MDO8840996.1 quinolinate synthase NadA [Methanocalculus sp.]